MTYAFDLRQVCGGYAYFSTFTHGSNEVPDKYETREPSEVDHEKFCAALSEIGHRPTIINSDASYQHWLCIQRWALVDSSFAHSKMPQWLKKHRCIQSSLRSYTDLNIASPSILKRNFRGNAKRKIHERDGNKCLICDAETELTLQHVWPYSFGGETSSRNLVTLCSECNQRLKNEIHIDLYRLAGLPFGFEPYLLNNSILDDQAFMRAQHISGNLMHTRCDVW